MGHTLLTNQRIDWDHSGSWRQKYFSPKLDVWCNQ